MNIEPEILCDALLLGQTRSLGVTLVLVAIVLVGTVLVRLLFRNHNSAASIVPSADTISIIELGKQLKQLADGMTSHEFTGITSNADDCLYFTFKNQLFNIEYEAISKSQIPFLQTLTEYAKQHDFDTELTTYGNTAQYKSDAPAPVLKIMANATIDEVVRIGTEIQSTVFGNSGETTYNVVP